MKRYLSQIMLASVMMLGLLSVVTPAPSVEAQAFSGSKSQACRGANLSNNETACREGEAATQINGVIRFVVNILTVIVGFVAVVLLIVNGLKFVTSNGDASSVTSAKQGVLYAIVGLIIVALAQVIVKFVLNKAA